jgi:uncharacterized protein YidB (DUF937 family)
MGLLDVLNGMQNGPRGQQTPSAAGSSGGLSPMTMAILGVLAYQAFKSFSNQPNAPRPATPAPTPNPGGSLADLFRGALGGTPSTTPSATPSGRIQDAGSGGSLGNVLAGGLGGLLGGGAAGSILSGGLGDLLKQFQRSGQEEVAKSWVGTGPNQAIRPEEMARALDPEQIKMLMAQTGLSRDELLAGLSEYLPEVVNEMTPHGRLPTEQEMARSLR